MASAEALKTPLHAWHVGHGGRMVEFGGWSMPVQYSSITEEHRAVRERVGLFDISHMGRLEFEGPGARDWLNYATTNDVARLAAGQIQYSLMANEDGGLLDDVLVYRMPDGSFRMVCNASNRERVLARLAETAGSFDATVHDRTAATAMIAVQGPDARAVLAGGVRTIDLEAIGYYHVAEGPFSTIGGAEVPATVSRTGYTGEDGFEVIVPAEHAISAWEMLLDSGEEFEIRPCGLGARDTLRFEAAMPLYGHELDETINPFEAGLGWAVKLGKGDFDGREALRRLKARPGRTRVGIELEGKRIARQGTVVKHEGRAIGSVTSGTFSPTLQRSLAMALVEPAGSAEGTPLTVDVRGHDEPARVVKLPFYRRDSN